MSFLAPLFLAGAAAIAFPFLFHLIRRNAKEKIPFSSLMFLEASPPRITKRSRLEHLLLLLLRCGVICLLALAFARPFFSRPVASGAAPEESVQVAILVDGSASMRREDLWEQAKRRAVEAARQAGPDARVGLFVFDQGLRQVVGFAETPEAGENVAGQVQAGLNGLEPGFGGTHIGQALLGGAELLLDQMNREQHEFGRGQLVVVTDLQAGARLDGLQGFEWPENLEVKLEVVEAKAAGNAGVQLLPPEAGLAFTQTNVAPRVRVQNATGTGREQFRVTWAANGIPRGEPLPVYVPPGESRIVSPPAPPEGANQMMLLDDPVKFDNQAWWAPLEKQEIAILYHGKGAAPDPAMPATGSSNPESPLYFAERAFEYPGSTLQVVRLGEAVKGVPGLMIIAEPLTDEAAARAGELLQAGRTVLAVVDNPALATSLGAIPGAPRIPAREAEVGNYALLGQIDFAHPLFRPFAEARYSDFTKIHFWKYRWLDLDGVTNAVVPARFDSGDPFLVEIPVGQGRLLAMASGWPPSESQFALSSKFVPLLYGILEQSLGKAEVAPAFLVGERVELPAALGAVEQVTGPDGVVRLERGSLEKPGIYRVEGADPYAFAVNLDPAETRVEPLPVEDLQALGVPLGPVHVPPGAEQLAEARQQHRLASEAEAQQKVWRWLLLGAVVLLFVEMWYAGRLSRPITPAEAGSAVGAG